MSIAETSILPFVQELPYQVPAAVTPAMAAVDAAVVAAAVVTNVYHPKQTVYQTFTLTCNIKADFHSHWKSAFLLV